MKKITPKYNLALAIFSFALIFSISNYDLAKAQATTTTTENKDQVEVSLPIQKSDFLLFYGITQDATTDAKILELRKDFTNKFDALKEEYVKSFNTIVGDKELSPIVSLDKSNTATEIKTAPQTASLKSVKIDTVSSADSIGKASVATQIKNTEASVDIKEVSTDKNAKPIEQAKYVLTNLKDGIVTPLVNIISDTPSIKIETSSWFQKIKS